MISIVLPGPCSAIVYRARLLAVSFGSTTVSPWACETLKICWQSTRVSLNADIRLHGDDIRRRLAIMLGDRGKRLIQHRDERFVREDRHLAVCRPVDINSVRQDVNRLDAARLLLSRGVSFKSAAAQVGLFPTLRLSESFERRFGVAPRLFREMHAGL